MSYEAWGDDDDGMDIDRFGMSGRDEVKALAEPFAAIRNAYQALVDRNAQIEQILATVFVNLKHDAPVPAVLEWMEKEWKKPAAASIETLETTPAMRARLVELSNHPGSDDYDRAVLMSVRDFDRLAAFAGEEEAEAKRSDASCVLRKEGKPYPRTCRVCGLGPCRYEAKVPATRATGAT